MNDALMAFDTFAEQMLAQLDPAVGVPPTIPVVTPEVQVDADAFSRLMSVQNEQIPVPAGVLFAHSPAPATQDPTKNLGNAIVSVADNVGSDYKQNIQRVYSALGRESLSTAELMRLQLDVAVASLEVEVVGKGVQKSVQHVDTLVNLK